MSERLFFGFETVAPWPHEWPKGRIIAEEMRHVTIAFLGHGRALELLKSADRFPLPSFLLGPTASCDALLFLPDTKARVASWHLCWLEQEESLESYRQALGQFLGEEGYGMEDRPFLPHVTIARAPFDKKEWEKAFHPLPAFLKALHLYESLGNSTYRSLWSHPLIPPFEEFEHTADIAFRIRGVDLEAVALHAQVALAFRFPSLLSYLTHPQPVRSLEEIIFFLNRQIAKVDEEIGSPFKAVSFHGECRRDKRNCLEWEMIVDI